MILQARSSVVGAMFNNNMEEASTHSVTITDIEPNILKQMLTFIYTGKAPCTIPYPTRHTNMYDNPKELFAATDKYDLKQLMALCEQKLCQMLNVHNAVELLLFADLCRAKKLKKASMKLIVMNIGVVTKLEIWEQELSNRFWLITEIFQFVEENN